MSQRSVGMLGQITKIRSSEPQNIGGKSDASFATQSQRSIRTGRLCDARGMVTQISPFVIVSPSLPTISTRTIPSNSSKSER